MTAWQTIDAALGFLGIPYGAPTEGSTTGGSHVANSEHYEGRARDYGSASSDPAAIARALLPYAQGAGAPVDELFYSPLNIFFDKGVAFTPDASLRQGHYDHVHVGLAPNVDLGQVVAGSPTSGATLTGFPGSGIAGDVIGGAVGSFFAPLKKIALTTAFVAGGVGLVALGGIRSVKRGS